jgi:hypothetical protein
MTTQIEALTAALNAAALPAKAWKGKRIYLNGYGRDISAYITLDDPDREAVEGRLFDGCALKVYSNCDSQSGLWRANRAKQVKHDIMTTLYGDGQGVTGYLGPICESWQAVIL